MSDRRSFLKQSTFASAGILFANTYLNQLSAQTRNDYSIQPLRFRQVHLDFHTSEMISDVAKDFDPEEFAKTLKNASVNSVTAFARCHHGYLYYDSKKHPERIHPNLVNKNLLKSQIEACRKQNIRVPVYTTVQWDHYTARQHPEWLVRDQNGTPIAFGNTHVFEAGFYNHLDIATPYINFLKDHIRDLFESVPVDGLFLDIHHIMPNANQTAIDGMLKKGLDPTKEEVRLQYNLEITRAYKEDLTAFIRKLDKDCTVFYNSGHVGPHIKNTIPSNSHLELESLPSGGWGYMHFPLTARYARNLGKEIMGMTGKFHTAWGDFHSLKNEAALEFETSMMLALNAKCSIGDQLHPRGKLDRATYDLIGNAYKKVYQKEAWCEGAKAVTQIGVLSSEEFTVPGLGSRTPEAMMGVVRILQEGAHQFDVLDSDSDFDKYPLLILPDVIPINGKLKLKLQNFLSKGGALLSSYRSGLTTEGTSFALPEMGVSLVGDAPYSPDFLVVAGPLSDKLPSTELVMYLKGLEVKPTSGAEMLMQTNVPYFNREWNHFSSHKHTPSSGKTGYPGVVKRGRSIYFMHPIFSQYNKNAPRWCKQLVLNAIKQLLPNPLVKHDGPSGLIAALNDQKEKQRSVLHLLYYTPERRGTDFDVIEDILPLQNVTLSVKGVRKIASVVLVPQNQPIPFKVDGDRVQFTIKEIVGHQMVALS